MKEKILRKPVLTNSVRQMLFYWIGVCKKHDVCAMCHKQGNCRDTRRRLGLKKLVKD